jgi:hypothetical protein
MPDTAAIDSSPALSITVAGYADVTKELDLWVIR